MRAVLAVVVFAVCVAQAPVAEAQDAPQSCESAGRAAGAEAGQGLRFEGDSNGFVSEPFSLPEGTVIVSAVIPSSDNPMGFWMIDLVPAPGSNGEVGFTVANSGNGPYEGAMTWDVTTPGEFVLTLTTSGEPWSATVEF